MKAKSKVDIRTPAGLVQAPSYCQWKQDIGGMEFEFALHIAAGHPKGFVAPLAISELGTGFDTKAEIRHPKSGAPLTSANVQGLNSGDVKSVAKSALHNLIHRRVGAGRFLQAMLGAQMQLSKIDLSKYEVKGEGTETYRNTEAMDKLRGLGTPGTATFSTTATPEQAAVLNQLIGPQCLTCDDHRVVTTTDKDHEGNNIEMACPACIPKATGGDPACDEYIPSPEEYAQAMTDADTMNSNMAKYGTIDAPVAPQPDWGSPTEEEWYEGLEPANKLEYLRSKLKQTVEAQQILLGRATKADHDRIDDMDDEIRDIEAKIAQLEGKPCSN